LIIRGACSRFAAGSSGLGGERGQQRERGLGGLEKNKEEGGASVVQGGPLLWVYYCSRDTMLTVKVSSNAAPCELAALGSAFQPAVSSGPTAVHQFTARLDIFTQRPSSSIKVYRANA
jgi:hypothetical protein